LARGNFMSVVVAGHAIRPSWRALSGDEGVVEESTSGADPPKADADGPNWTGARIAEAFHRRVQSIENLRKRLVTEGFDAALNRKVRESPPTPPLLDGQGEAKLIALRLGKSPVGYGTWTLQLLADELVSLEVVDSISDRVTLVCDNLNTHTIGAFDEAFEPEVTRQ
jgi:hypothetical protein